MRERAGERRKEEKERKKKGGREREKKKKKGKGKGFALCKCGLNPSANTAFPKRWPASALACFYVANLLRTEQNFVLQNRGLGSGGENTRPPNILPFFPEQRSSDVVLPFFRTLLPTPNF